MSGYSAQNDTLPYACTVGTGEEMVRIVTHDKVALFFRNPHTSIIPAGMTRSGYVGCTLEWKTADPATLALLHDHVIQLVQLLGAAGMFEIGKSVKAAMMLYGPDISQTVERAKKEGIDFPLPPLVVSELKRFK
jgi:hypothetical protein